jgi:hypothetical protein
MASASSFSQGCRVVASLIGRIGGVRPIRSSRRMDGKTGAYAATLSKSSGAVQLEIWSGPEAYFRILQLINRGVDEGEFRKIRICLKRSMARSRRQNGKCEFSALLSSRRPVSPTFTARSRYRRASRPDGRFRPDAARRHGRGRYRRRWQGQGRRRCPCPDCVTDQGA